MNEGVITSIMGPIALLLVGAVVSQVVRRLFERRPRVAARVAPEAYFLRQDGQMVWFSALTVSNSGKAPATNLRILHPRMPAEFALHPARQHSVEIAGQGTEVVLDTLVPGEEVTLKYLGAFPIRSDDVVIRHQGGVITPWRELTEQEIGWRMRTAVWPLIALTLVTLVIAFWKTF